VNLGDGAGGLCLGGEGGQEHEQETDQSWFHIGLITVEYLDFVCK
jgi:hypothetical protein